MRQTTTNDGKNYAMSNAGVLVPAEQRFELDHPVASKVMSAAGKAAAIVALPVAVTIGSGDAEANPVPKATPNHLFAGTMGTVAGDQTTPESDVKRSLDTLVTYGHDNGTKIHLLSENTLGSNALSGGFKTPFFVDRVSLSGVANGNFDSGDESYLGMVEVDAGRGILVRGGVFHDSDIGGFVGAKAGSKYFALDVEGWALESDMSARAFAAGNIPLKGGWGSLYLGAGHDLSTDNLIGVLGWFNKGGTGAYAETKFNVETNASTGKVVITPFGSTFGKGKGDFRGHYLTGTNMNQYASVMDGWAPFDVMAADAGTGNLVVVGKWAIESAGEGEVRDVEGTVYWRPSESVFLGLGVGDMVFKDDAPNARAELYAKIPKTPLEAWFQVDTSLKTGDTNFVGYAGIDTKF